MNKPEWTVLYNIDSKTRWVGTGWEFFDTETEARATMEARQKEGHCCGMRPFHEGRDRQHMGASHQRVVDNIDSVINEIQIDAMKYEDKPTKPGYYWIKNWVSSKPVRIVKVFTVGTSYKMFTSEDGGACTDDKYYNNHKWYGPIKSPELF